MEASRLIRGNSGTADIGSPVIADTQFIGCRPRIFFDAGRSGFYSCAYGSSSGRHVAAVFIRVCRSRLDLVSVVRGQLEFKALVLGVIGGRRVEL